MKKMSCIRKEFFNTFLNLTFVLLFFSIGCAQNNNISKNKELQFYPQSFKELPDIPSPGTLENGIEVIVAHTKDNEFTIIPVTVENGEPHNYEKGQWGKGNQFEVNSQDFPGLANTGLHSDIELNEVSTIGGRSLADITKNGQPGIMSTEGFMASNEDIISVLKGDNALVKRLGLTHPQLANPLFNIFNLILVHRKYYLGKIRPYEDIDYIIYNGGKIYLQWGGAKGWQRSIFNDNILGYYEINIWIELNHEEIAYLNGKYSYLNDEQMKELMTKLSHIHTGEMVPYYIMKYGFYEGHTAWRADPIAISFIFGIKSLSEIDRLLDNDLYTSLIQHYTK
ncbi:MAG: hypothetical protein KAV70_00365 [Bacteroidales bacterium]|jgi:hypothetical protein|nr:hypothetical protein [Bacteroidales bacterium]MCK4406315.1 hypothetical protein [Bacteroidales bacterium]MCK4638028.1 hypothetical protein [Bacteroidales bacterium]